MKKLLSTTCLCLAVLMNVITPHASAAPTLSYSATPGPDVSVATTFDIGIDISDVADLYAYNLSLQYMPTVVQFVGITEGAFLPGAGTTFFIPGLADEAAGLISFTGASLIGDIAGASGSGRLFTLSFNTLAAPDGTLATFFAESPLFINSTFAETPVDLGERFSVRVANPDGGVVPEPSLLMLLLAGAGALAFTRRVKS